MERLDAIARGLASGMSRREALRTGGLAVVGVAAITPADAWAKLTGHCPHKHPHRCSGKCVNTKSDRHNCGRCGHKCGAGQHCARGHCACPSGQAMCSGVCVTLASDPKHCGACGKVCGSGETCSAGVCEPTQCPSGQTRCGAGCVDAASDPNNCGQCGLICQSGQVCASGQCTSQCAAGQTNCSGACVDTQSDFHNCGACGTVCSSFFATSSCQSGTCHIDSCSPNWVNCDGDPLTGCETIGTTCPP